MWVFSEKTSAKSSHHSGMTGSVDRVAWAIWVEMVVLLICSPFSQACHLFSLREIFGPHLGLANVGDIVGEYNQGVERLVTLEWKQC